ncbi:EAL domain-containing protein [Frankia sp. AgB32]|nr:EAL domain-containing protein [Frankia sp. AgB32]
MTAAGDTVGAEAVIRWHHPARGLLMPEAFIPIAEKAGLIVAIGQWALETGCREASHWGPRPPDAPTPRLLVGVSVHQLRDGDFAARLATILTTTGAGHRYRLCLEISAQALARDNTGLRATLDLLHGMGVTFCLGGFGAGHSGIDQLRDLPIDSVKTDRRLTEGFLTNPADHAILAAVIQLAHALGLRVIADGVETVDQLTGLDGLGCDLFQARDTARPRTYQR